MKKYPLLLLLLSMFSSFKYQPKPLNWAGHYVYEEQPVKGAGGISDVMQWDVNINPKGNTGTVEINGQQTYFKLFVDVVAKDDAITLIYNKTLDGVDYSEFKKGNTLLTLKKLNSKTITMWAILTPRLTEKFPKTCACFVKK